MHLEARRWWFVAAVCAVVLASLVSAAGAFAWTWPAEGPVLRPFSVGPDPYAGGQHRGVDIGAAVGQRRGRTGRRDRLLRRLSCPVAAARSRSRPRWLRRDGAPARCDECRARPHRHRGSRGRRRRREQRRSHPAAARPSRREGRRRPERIRRPARPAAGASAAPPPALRRSPAPAGARACDKSSARDERRRRLRPPPEAPAEAAAPPDPLLPTRSDAPGDSRKAKPSARTGHRRADSATVGRRAPLAPRASRRRPVRSRFGRRRRSARGRAPCCDTRSRRPHASWADIHAERAPVRAVPAATHAAEDAGKSRPAARAVFDRFADAAAPPLEGSSGGDSPDGWPVPLTIAAAVLVVGAWLGRRRYGGSRGALEGARMMNRHENTASTSEDPRRSRVAVCERPAPHRPRGGIWRSGGHLRPLPPVARKRRPHGQRDGRARHAGDGRRRSGRRLAA